MLVSTAISEILRVINNQNRSTEALLWLQETLREIKGVARWRYLLTDVVGPFAQATDFPVDMDEMTDPVLLDDTISVPYVNYLKTNDTTPTITGTVPSDPTDPLTVTVNGVTYAEGDGNLSLNTATLVWTLTIPVGNILTTGTTYTVTVDADDVAQTTQNQLVIDSSATTAVTSVWNTPLAAWEEEDVNKLQFQRNDYRLDPDQLVLHTRWTQGEIRLRYYREMTIPTLTTATIDLPDDFVYRLTVYGAARHGLVGEDDFDRLTVATGIYERALNDMKVKDARRKVANMTQQMGGEPSDPSLAPWPSNYSR